jgi:hypothetical protein
VLDYIATAGFEALGTDQLLVSIRKAMAAVVKRTAPDPAALREYGVIVGDRRGSAGFMAVRLDDDHPAAA